MIRRVLRDDQWQRMEPHGPGRKSDPERSGTDIRFFLKAVLWKAPPQVIGFSTFPKAMNISDQTELT
jgi:hypothetical protein